MNAVDIRALLGVNRTEFSRRYGIPLRTLEHWDGGDRIPPDWVLSILEKAVRYDMLKLENGHENGHADGKSQ